MGRGFESRPQVARPGVAQSVEQQATRLHALLSPLFASVVFWEDAYLSSRIEEGSIPFGGATLTCLWDVIDNRGVH